MLNLNNEGLTWPEWYCAAMPGSHVCCHGNAWGACSERCPRVNVKAAPAPLVTAWQAGEDPTEYRAASEREKQYVKDFGIKPECPHCGHNRWVYDLNVYGTLACQRHGWNAFG